MGHKYLAAMLLASAAMVGCGGVSRSSRTVDVITPSGTYQATVGTGGYINDDRVLISPATATQPAQYREQTYHRRTVTIPAGNLGERTVDIKEPD